MDSASITRTSNMSPGRPGIKVMVKNLAQTARDVTQGALSGDQVLAEDATVQTRLETCSKCALFRIEDSRCLQCGCFMTAKVKLQAAKCPISKW